MERYAPKKLRELCAAAWLDDSGTKSDLLQRLVEFEMPADGWPQPKPKARRVGKARAPVGQSGAAATGGASEAGGDQGRSQYEEMSMPALKAMCRARLLNPNGTKPNLVRAVHV